MDSAAPAPDQPDAAPPDAEAAARARKAVLVERLDRLGLWAMELAEKSQQLAMAATECDLAALAAVPADSPALPAESNGPVLAFARAARVARDCIALEMKITAPARHDDDARRMSPAARRRLSVMKDEVRKYVEFSIRSHAEPRHVDSLLMDLDDRLDDPDVEAEFGTLTIGQMVLSVCRDLEVKADLTTWPEEMLITARVAATHGRWQPPPTPPRSNGMARGLPADPTIEKLPTGVIGTPGVPPAIDLPPWSHSHPSQPPPTEPLRNGHAGGNAGHDPPAAPRRPPGASFAR
jgi:hypothetical protein